MDRKKITFSQAEGLEPLPQPLKLGELSKEFRARLFGEIYKALEAEEFGRAGLIVGPRWKSILRDVWVELLHEPVDEYSTNWDRNVGFLRQHILISRYNNVLDLTQAIMRHRQGDPNLNSKIKQLFDDCLLAYTIIDDGPTIIPRPSDEELAAIQRGLTDSTALAMSGAKRHLLDATEALSKNDFTGCVRESIHSVESCAQVLSGKTHATLGDALGALASKGIEIHPAFEKGISNLYGYTSNEKGIRHALSDSAAKVDMTDAIFMLGACASFVSYLINKGRQVGLVKS